MSTPITSFSGEYRFLSNFYPVDIEYGNLTFPSVEHAYVAAKTEDVRERKYIASMSSAGQAKVYGRGLLLRRDWDSVKTPIMTGLVLQKFRNPELRERLKATHPLELIEGNTWGDRYWGQCPVGNGKNILGEILMSTRNMILMEDIE